MAAWAVAWGALSPRLPPPHKRPPSSAAASICLPPRPCPLPPQDKALRPEDLAPANPKLERIRQASAGGAQLAPAFTVPTPRERQLLAAAAAFKQRWVAGAAAAAAAGAPCGRLLPAVTLLNECGAEKAVCTTLRPASLPHAELYDLEGIAQVWLMAVLAGGRAR